MIGVGLMYTRLIGFRRLGVIVLLFAVAGLVAACGSDPEPTPTPTVEPTAVPTATPVPTPTPEPTPAPTATPTPVPPSATEPGVSLEDFVVDVSTTGQDLMDVLSEGEVSCIQSTFGDAIFQIMMSTPLLLAGGNTATAAPMFACLEIESAVYIAFAFVEAQAGGWSADTRGCMIAVGLEHPDAFMTGMGLSPSQDATAAAATHPYLVEIYNCMTLDEQVTYLLNFQEVIDVMTTAEKDLIGAIPEADVACIRDALTDAEYETLISGTVHEAFDVSDAVAGCMSDDAYVQSFVSISDTTIGDLSDDTKACLTEFAREHPHYTALLNAHAYDPSAVSTEDLAEIAQDGLKTWACMTVEEIQRSQGISTRALGGG